MRTTLSSSSSSGGAIFNGGTLTFSSNGDITRLDAYAVVEMGDGWQSLTSMGCGWHSFDLRREYQDGRRVQAEGVDGTSFNLMEEVNYTMSAGEKGSLQPFFAMEMSVNHLDGFDEEGAGNASLHGESRSAWAMDLTLEARYRYRFAALEKVPEATLGVEAGVVASVGDTMTEPDLNYRGAPEQKFTVSSAERNRWGYQISAMLTLPVAAETAVFVGGGAVLRGDSHQTNAQMGVRVNF